MTSLAALGRNALERMPCQLARVIRIELCPQKGLKVQIAVLCVKFLSFFRSGWKSRGGERQNITCPPACGISSSTVLVLEQAAKRD